MLVSIIVCSHSLDRYHDLMEAVDSLRNQDFHDIELVVVIDNNTALFNLLTEFKTAGGFPVDVLVHNDSIKGLSASRNVGVHNSKGEIVAFFDDDAVADKNWITQLVWMYKDYDAVAAGGIILPDWSSIKRPDFLPDEYLWLVGATHKGFRKEFGIVRNAFGSNMSFRKDVILMAGGFRTAFGFNGAGLIQGEEAELCSRIYSLSEKPMMYNPDAIVYHKVFPERLKLRALIKRLFYQGYSKRMIEETKSASLLDESNFLKFMVFTSIPDYTYKPLLKLGFMFLFTLVVLTGYCYRLILRK